MVIIMGDVLWFCDMAIKCYIIFFRNNPFQIHENAKKNISLSKLSKRTKKKRKFSHEKVIKSARNINRHGLNLMDGEQQQKHTRIKI